LILVCYGFAGFLWCRLPWYPPVFVYVFIPHGGAVSWWNRLQPTISLSEHLAAAASVKEALWLKKLFAAVGIWSMSHLCTSIFCDNQDAISIDHMRSKHIDVQHHFVCERVALHEVVFSIAVICGCAITRSLPRCKKFRAW
jgi:hypothetical protein